MFTGNTPYIPLVLETKHTQDVVQKHAAVFHDGNEEVILPW